METLPESTPVIPKRTNAVWTVRVITIATVLVEGYDMGITSGVLPLLRQQFGFTKAAESMWASLVFAGIVVGAPWGSFVADALGRKTALGVMYLLLITGPLMMALSVNFSQILAGRIIEGLAVGAGLSVVSTYLAEIAPAGERGQLVGLEELCLVAGGAIGNLTCCGLYGIPGDWRWMLGLGALPPLLLGMLIVFCTVPESPRWLHAQGCIAEANAALIAYVGPDEAASTIQQWQQEKEDLAPWSKVLMPDTAQKRDNLISGLVVATVNGAGGITVIVMYLGTMILSEVKNDRIGYTYLAGFGFCRVIIVLFTLTRLSDRMSRRSMFLISTTGTTLSCVLIAMAYAMELQLMPWKMIGISCFAIAHGLGNGPATWPYLGEVCSTDVRSKSIALFMMCSRSLMGLLVAAFPLAKDIIGATGIFIFFCGVNSCGLLLMYHYVRDVSGLTLEEANKDAEKLPM